MWKLWKPKRKIKVTAAMRESACVPASKRVRTSTQQVALQEQQILRALRAGAVTPRAVAASTGLAIATVRVRLYSLLERDLVWRDDAGPMTSYYPTQSGKC